MTDDLYWQSVLRVEGMSLEQAQAEADRLEQAVRVIEQQIEIALSAAESQFGADAARAIREKLAANLREHERHLAELKARATTLAKGPDQPS